MKKQLVIIGMTLLLFAVGLSGCTDNKNVSSWTGTWDTDWNFYGDVALKTELTLNQKADGSVTGTYTYNSTTGTIEGTVDGYVLTGISTEEGSDYPIKFTMSSDGKSFTGIWYDGTTERGTWNGVRL
jgi:hypothetical protein